MDIADVRFKGNGLETIEVQDNGVGISSENYQTVGKSLGSCKAMLPSLMSDSSVEALYIETREL